MTKEQAIEASIAVWTHVVETGEKPAYAVQFNFECPLCDLYNNKYIWDTDYNLRCFNCPLHDGIPRSCGCCEEFEKWVKERNQANAQAMLDKLLELFYAIN